MSGRKAYITGQGVISSIGLNLEENLNSLKNYQSGISHLKILETNLASRFPCGEIKLTNNELISKFNLKLRNKDIPRTLLLAIIAVKEALENSGVSLEENNMTGLIMGSTVGGMDKTERYFGLQDSEKEYICSHSFDYSINYLAKYFNITKYTAGISTACSSAANAIMSGARLIQSRVLDRVVVGGTDALSKFTLNGFASLMILDEEKCKTFDNKRKGLNLGEAAAFLVLESEDMLGDKEPYAVLNGYGNADDAHHQTASSPEATGAYLSMKKALNIAGFTPEDISYINAHGTGTANNDLTESVGFNRLFGSKIPHFSSTKGFTGHTLGAAGAIEAVFSVLSIKNNIVWPNLNFNEPISETGLLPEQKLTSKEIRNVMSNSFGFGGNNTSLIFSDVK